jgi:N-acetylmuramoyl-L-alanine amidase
MLIRRICVRGILLVLACVNCIAQTSAQPNTIRVHFEADPGRTIVIGAFQRQGIIYGSLNDIASVFSLGTYENRDARKFEIKHSPLRLKVTGGNPYVILIDQSQRQTSHQLPVNAIFAANAYFVPLEAFTPHLSGVFNLNAVFDPRERVIRVAGPHKVSTFDIPTITMETRNNGMLIRIPAAKPLPEYESWLRQDGWLYVTIADANADVKKINALKPSGLVRRIVAIQSPGSVQLTFRLSGKIAASEIIKDANSNDLLVAIRTPGAEDKLLLESKRREVLAGIENARKRYNLDVIVIDPGHGGKEPGSIGITGTKEKDITLGIGLRLGKLIEQNLKGVKVVYTRKDDSFVELFRRGQIANEADGKLFISIHGNSLPKKRGNERVRGFEVYLLRPGRTEEAIEIAERENAVIKFEEGYEERYKELTEENFILVSMAQSAYLKASEVFADIAQQEMEKRLSIPNRGVKQAGFYVLVGASMPKVLVETAYLSNREDEKFLRSAAGQQKIAEALYHAIARYKDEYEKTFLETKDVGAR